MKLEWQFIEKCKEALFGNYWLVFIHGGRGGGKSWAIANYFIFESLNEKHRYLCIREIQNSIEESVYHLLKEIIAEKKIEHLFYITNNKITCSRTGSEFVFKGLQASAGRGDSIKSLEGFDRVWGEEAHAFSETSIEKLLPTIREKNSRLFFTFNRNKNNDPIWKLAQSNYPNKLILKINYYENPYCPENIIMQAKAMKARDYQRYLHVFRGEPDDNAENTIINRQWVQAAFELYKNEKISGAKIVSLDVADEGSDKNATCHRYGNAVVYLNYWSEGDTKQTTHKTISLAKQNGFYPCKRFIFDRVGVGAGVRAEIKEYAGMEIVPYNGGGAVINPKQAYEVNIRNEDMFENLKAQDYWYVRDMLYNAYRKLKGEPVEDYIVINPDIKDDFGNPLSDQLEDELCQVKKKESNRGKLLLIDKKPNGCRSPNLADAVVMAFTKYQTFKVLVSVV